MDKRVSCSVPASEVMDCSDAIDRANSIKQDLQIMTASFISLEMMIDGLSLFDLRRRASVRTEKRWPIDQKTVKDSYESMDLQEIGYVRSEHNIVDALTKVIKSRIM